MGTPQWISHWRGGFSEQNSSINEEGTVNRSQRQVIGKVFLLHIKQQHRAKGGTLRLTDFKVFKRIMDTFFHYGQQ